MRRRLIVLLILVVAGGGGFAWWWFDHDQPGEEALVLYGNVDLRQVDLAFDDSGRIAAVLVDEGERVTAGEVLARLDTGRIQPQIAQAEAEVAAQRAVVKKLHAGSRPEEIEQARAEVAAAEASAENARLTHQRLTTLKTTAGGGAAVTQSQIDAARAAKDSAEARVRAAEQVLALAEAGPRAEDVAQAEAQLEAATARLALLKQQLEDAELTSPVAGVVRSRLLEPGEMASPERPVLSLAIVDPKWVRAYISEPDLPKVAPGAEATVAVDGVPGRALTGRVGFISPVAEFTPRSIQTEDLRTNLVYEVRVLVDDPDDMLRLGMPATVRLTTRQAPATTAEAEP